MNFKHFGDQNYERLKQKHLSERTLFKDPLFDANQKSLYRKSCPTHISRNLNYQVFWKRPSEIVRNPKFTVDGANPLDIHQGVACGNCWFIAAMVDIANRPEYFKVVVPDDQSFDSNDYCGIFHFRFWQFGEWVDVVIDDRLPVDHQNKLLYCSNTKSPNEFWCSLFEKAYAKLATCYEFLDGGFTQDGLVDLTGGVSECFDLPEMRGDKAQSLWSFIHKAYKLGSVSGAAINKEADDQVMREGELANGLWTGHAYSITKVAEIPLSKRTYDVYYSLQNKSDDEPRGRRKGFGDSFYYYDDEEDSNFCPSNTICLMRLRNPWGHHEWKGPWSDQSYEWSQISDNDKRELGLNYDADGEFWMSFQDFIRNFTFLDFVHINLHAFFDEIRGESISKYLGWNCKQYHGEWIPNVSAGGSGQNNRSEFWKNPQYLVTVKDVDPNDNEQKATLIVSLMYKENNKIRSNNRGQLQEFPKQFRLFKIKNQYKHLADKARHNNMKLDANHMERIGSSQTYSLMREVSMRFRLDPGEYVIIPSTYDANVPGKFLLRLFTEIDINDVDVSNLEDNNPKNEHNDSDAHFNEIEDTLFDQFGDVIPSDDMNKIIDQLGSRFVMSNNDEDEAFNNEISDRLFSMSQLSDMTNKFKRVAAFQNFFRYKDN